MAVNFGILTQQPTIGERFAMGQQEAQRNLLAQQQLEQSRQQNALMATQAAELQRKAALANRLPTVLQGVPAAATVPEQVDILTRAGYLGEARQLAESHAKAEADRRAAEGADLKNQFERLRLTGQLLSGATDEQSYRLVKTQIQQISPQFAAAALPDAYDPGRISALINQGRDLEKRIADETARRGQDITAETTRRGQDITAATAKAGQAVTMRGQDITAATARRGQDITAATTAPTVTTIQDPKNPNNMITVDARRYKPGGSIGDPGVLGSSGKTAPAEEKRVKQEQGKTQALDILDNLRTAYDTLDQKRALPSEQRGVVSNTLSWIAGTGVGQTMGRMGGTAEQTQRDIISSARNQMLNALKTATGMSAQQLNSNVELRTWLDSLSDPTKSIQANRAILDHVQKFIDTNGAYSARASKGSAAPAGAAPAGAAPAAAPRGAGPTVSNW